MQKNEAGTYQFDLKETVQLFPNQLPIEEIEDMELIPQVEIEERGEEIDISGSLYLFGNYRGNLNAGKLDAGEIQPSNYQESVQFEPLSVERGPFSPLAKEDKFEYRIPVRISLPKGKVRDVSEVYAYINSFDYELKTPYQIEVLASLVIAGFKEEEEQREEQPAENFFGSQLEQREEQPAENFFGSQLEQREEQPAENFFGSQLEQREEQPAEHLLDSQLEFVHVAGGNPENQADDVFEQRMQAIEEQIASLEEQGREESDVAAGGEAENVNAIAWSEQPVFEEIEEPRAHELEEVEEPEAEYELQPGVVPVEEYLGQQLMEERDNVIPLPHRVEEEEPDSLQEIEEELDKDVKVAISKKGTKQDRENITSLSSIFGKLPRIEEPVAESSQPEREDLDNNEALYLTNFMGNQDEQFTKVKICIIQKNESIDDIADRYKLQVETILRANQTARNQVMAGQILYIPVKG